MNRTCTSCIRLVDDTIRLVYHVYTYRPIGQYFTIGKPYLRLASFFQNVVILVHCGCVHFLSSAEGYLHYPGTV